MNEIKLIKGDSLQALKGYGDNYFDWAIVDPPYKEETTGLSAGFNRSHFNYETLTKPPTIVTGKLSPFINLISFI